MNNITIEAIKQNIKYHNYKIKDLALLIGVTPKTISLIISGKSKLTYDVAWKLDTAFGLPRNTLFNLQESEKRIKELKADKDMNKMADSIDAPEFERMDKISILQRISQMFKGATLGDFKNYLKSNSVDFYKYKDKPLAYYWIAKMDNEFGTLKSSGEFKMSMQSTVIKNVLDIMISKGNVYKRIGAVEEYLDSKGIILRNGQFIKKSTINGCVLKKDKQYFIFMNDYMKREHQYIFALVHELLHIYGMREEDNELVAKTIEDYMNKYGKEHKELTYVIAEYRKGNSKETFFENVHDNTFLKVDFGNRA